MVGKTDGQTAEVFKCITTDDTLTVRAALIDAFGDRVKRLLCLWHVARAWSQKIRSVFAGVESSDNLQSSARSDLRDIMNEMDIFEARKKIAAFCVKWAPFPLFIDYMNNYYFRSVDRMRSWMKAYRTKPYMCIMNTNNYVESWHNHLKSHVLKNHRGPRGDRLLWLLSHSALDYLQHEESRAFIQVERKTKGQALDLL
ncbi:hypothetical protein BGZ46_006116 [Entomortierella lignicola]|nr:hypothetical protein BGZ46_006116 [Entomortierella lignicola]